MNDLEIERLGGFAGFGGPGSPLRSRGALTFAELTPHVRSKVDQLFDDPRSGAARQASPDEFRYRITRTTPQGAQTIEVPESVVPDELQASVTNDLA